MKNCKLLTCEQAVAQRNKLRSLNQKVVLVNGGFDLLHDGHLSYLKNAKKLGDALFVALNADESVRALKGLTRPIQAVEERAFALSLLSYVDTIFIFNTKRIDKEILELKPDIYCKAGDYTLDKLNVDERLALEKIGAKIKFVPFLPGFSTTKIISNKFLDFN